MAAYLLKAKKLLGSLSSYTIHQILRSQNAEADAFARLASVRDTDQPRFIPVETLHSLSIQTEEPHTVNCAAAGDNWITPIVRYLKNGVLLEDKRKARLLRLKVVRYTLYDDRLYKRGFSTPLLKCVDLEQRSHILQEIHGKICDNHPGGQSLVHKALRQGYFGQQ